MGIRQRYVRQVYYERLAEFPELTHAALVPSLTSLELHWNQRDFGLEASARAGSWALMSRLAGSSSRPSVHRSRKSVAALRLRQGMPVGVSVRRTGRAMDAFLDAWLARVVPRLRPWSGVPMSCLDRHGNRTRPIAGVRMFDQLESYYELFLARSSRSGLTRTLHTRASEAGGSPDRVRARAAALLSGVGRVRVPE